MEQVLNTYYCSFCEKVAAAWSGFVNFWINVGTARAAADLARMGYYKEADSLIRKEFLK
jgi:hypothetical protein